MSRKKDRGRILPAPAQNLKYKDLLKQKNLGSATLAIENVDYLLAKAGVFFKKV